MTADGTATTADNLKQKLVQQLDTTRVKLEALKRSIVDMHEEDIDNLRRRREEIRRRLDGQKDRARKLHAHIATWRQEKAAHTQEAIGSWRRELEKLQVRAERAEDYAVDLVTVAALDFEEAEQAVLDAVAARFDADAASSTSNQ